MAVQAVCRFVIDGPVCVRLCLPRKSGRSYWGVSSEYSKRAANFHLRGNEGTAMKTGVFNFLIAVILLIFFYGSAFADSRRLTLNAGAYSIAKDKQRFDIIKMPGFDSSGSPGDPQLPHKIYNILVPPDTILSSLRLHIIQVEPEILEGIYNIKPAPPAATLFRGRSIVYWGKEKDIVNDKNVNVYGLNEKFPKCPIKQLPYSQMRKWKYKKVDFTPFQYNPVSGKLTLIKKVIIEISYSRSGISSRALIEDRVMDGVAPKIFFNYKSAKKSYISKNLKGEVKQNSTYDYVIITTNAIKAGSAELTSFIFHKQALGHHVLVVTENDFGSLTGQSPNHKAEKIREWLQDNYLSMGIEYVLLIGDPCPYESGQEGDIPMKMCWPTYNEPEYRDCPTDYFYADLTGNWDLDGDGYYGKYPDDIGPGGVDFSPEVYVGRIPVYDSDYSTLDDILQKIIVYETTGNPSWREKAILPLAITNFENEDNDDGFPRTDSAELGQDMMTGYLNSEGFTSYTLYEKDGLDPSTYLCDTPLNEDNLINEWQNGYGVACWDGHGSESGVYRKIWSGDDGDGIPESSEISSLPFFDINDCLLLNNARPSFLFQVACLNGYPENSSNLAYALLKNGAIGTSSATRVSWYMGGWDDPYLSCADDNSIAYYFFKRLIVDKDPAGKALFLTHASMGDDWGDASWQNKMDYVLYGDPATSIYSQPGYIQPGDANGDGQINVGDVICIINNILDPTSSPFGNPDCNSDGDVNILDVICLINKILAG